MGEKPGDAPLRLLPPVRLFVAFYYEIEHEYTLTITIINDATYCSGDHRQQN